MLAAETCYLEDTIRAHVRRFFSDEARSVFDAVPLRWCSMAEASSPTERTLIIPTDVPAAAVPDDAWQVPFGGTRLTFWNALPLPSPEWRLQDPSAPLWYVHPSGAIMPAWNLAAPCLIC